MHEYIYTHGLQTYITSIWRRIHPLIHTDAHEHIKCLRKVPSGHVNSHDDEDDDDEWLLLLEELDELDELDELLLLQEEELEEELDDEDDELEEELLEELDELDDDDELECEDDDDDDELDDELLLLICSRASLCHQRVSPDTGLILAYTMRII
jgi:hypothetical protein